MQTWDFSLIIDGPDCESEGVLDSLLATCTDEPLIGWYGGQQEAMFIREAHTLEEAVLSAIADIENVHGFSVIGLRDESILSLQQIAERSGYSVSQLAQLVAEGTVGATFPKPLSDPSDPEPQWSARELVPWFSHHMETSLTDSNAPIFAALTDALNARTSCRRLPHESQQRIRALIAS